MQLPAAMSSHNSSDALALGVRVVARRSDVMSHPQIVSSHPRFVMSHATGGSASAC